MLKLDSMGMAGSSMTVLEKKDKGPPANSKRPWTPVENKQLLDLVQKFGAKRWSLIATHLPGRVGKQCRERYDVVQPNMQEKQHTHDSSR